MSITTGITAHSYPHAGGELAQIQQTCATVRRQFGDAPPLTIAVWSYFRGVWSIERTDEIVLVMHCDAWREVERQIIPNRAAQPEGVLTQSLLGMRVIDIDAGGAEAMRLRGIISDAISRALGGVGGA